MIEAVEAPRIFIPEKIKTFATVARMTVRIIKNKLGLVTIKTFFIEPWLKNINGETTNAAIIESINTKTTGLIPIRIFWSIT